MSKRVVVISLLLVGIFFAFRFCGTKPEQEKVSEQKTVALNSESSGSFNDSYAKLFQTYLILKEAFANADTIKVNSAATELSGNSDSLQTDEIAGDTAIRETAKYFAGSISASAKALAGESKREEKLKELNMITDQLWSLTRTVKYDRQKVYYHFCADALDNMGGYWLSDKIDSGNPYITSGSCSEVKDSIDYGKK